MFIRKISAVCLCCFLFVSSVMPLSAHAEHLSVITKSLRKKFDALGDQKVKNVPLPIILGTTLKNLTPNFGDSREGGRSHEGLDIMAPMGVPVVSPTKAVVIRTGTGASSGKYVNTMNPGGETFIYMHLSEISVDEGDAIEAGDLIGFVGNTGNAAGGAPHLHFEIRDTKRKPTDPFPRLTKEFNLEEKIKSLTKIIAFLKKK